VSPSFRPCLVCGRICERRGVSRCDLHRGREPFSGSKLAYTRMPENVRQAVLARDGHRCVRCGSTTRLEVDHIVPVSRGGQHTVANGRTLCRPCHLKATGADFGFGGRLR
jgi:hypothetical protein